MAGFNADCAPIHLPDADGDRPLPRRGQPAGSMSASQRLSPNAAVREALVAVALAALTLAVFAPACGNGFVNYDDEPYVTKNPHVQSGLSWSNSAWAFRSTEAANWHPLTWLSLQLDAQVYHLDPWGFHLTNVLWHTANTVLLFGVLRRMTGACWRSALVAALFAVHPLHVESVAWIAERKDVLSTLFGFLAMAAYVRYAARPGPGRYLVVAAAFLLALLAKPMLVTLPCILLLLDYWPLGRIFPKSAPTGTVPPSSLSHRRALLEKVPLFALAAASCSITLYAQHQGNAVHSLAALPIRVRVENALMAYVGYIGKMLWPANLAVFYPHPENTIPTWQVVGAVLLLLGITSAVLLLARPYPYLPVGWLWYLGTLVPVIGLVQVGSQALADRYTYIPLIGLFLILAWGLGDWSAAWSPVRWLVPSFATLVLLALGFWSWVQVDYWHDSRLLWSHTVLVTGDNALARYNLGMTLENEGDHTHAAEQFAWAVALNPNFADARFKLGFLLEQAGDRAGARREYEATLRANPQHAKAHNNLGVLLAREGDLDEAIRHLRDAARGDPANADVPFNLGLILTRQGNLEEAVQSFSAALALDPENARVINQKGVVLFVLGRNALAKEALTEAVSRQPRVAGYRADLGHVLHAQGEATGASVQFKEALRLDPRWPEATAQRAWALATQPVAGRRNGALAVFLAEEVCEATAFQQPAFLDVLAAAYAEAGRFSDAQTAARRALALADQTRPDLARAIAERLRDYEQGRPFRTS
jgi:tetratricopeptide (TPR) repeat protein